MSGIAAEVEAQFVLSKGDAMTGRSVRGEQTGDHAGQDAVEEVVGAVGGGREVLHAGG
jgi:hypothetical protein